MQVHQRMIFYLVSENAALDVVLQPVVRARFRQLFLAMYFVWIPHPHYQEQLLQGNNKTWR